MKKRKRNLVVVLPVLLGLFISACGMAATSTRSDEVIFIEEPALGAPSVDFAGELDSSGGFTGQSEQVAVAQNAERLVIKNANLSLVVDDPEASMDEIAALAERLGGFVVSSNLYQTTTLNGLEVPSAYITVRVPADTFQQTLDTIRTEAIDVLSDTQTGQDVTAEYTDLQSRLRNLQDAEELLRQIMEEARDTEDVLNAFNQLNYITEQIEVLKGQIQYYEESAALSAISVELTANDAVQPLQIGPWTPVGAAKDAIESLIRALQDIVDGAVWLLLYVLPVLLVIGLPIWLLARGVRRWLSRRTTKTGKRGK